MRNVSKIVCIGLAAASLVVACVSVAGCGSSNNSTAASSSNEASDEDKGGFDIGKYTLVEAGKLTVGSDLAYPPMEYLDSKGKPAGFDVAVIQDICDRLGLELNYLPPQKFNKLLTKVASGKTMDVATSTISVTEERAQIVSFSNYYYESNLAIVIKEGAYANRSALNSSSVTVAAQSGTSCEDWIAENLPNANYVAYDDNPVDAMADLEAGKIQAVVYDEPIAKSQTSETGSYGDCEILETISTGEQYSIAVNKNNAQLLADINTCIAQMEDDGTLEEIAAEYLE